MATKFDASTQKWVEVPESNTPNSSSNSGSTSSSSPKSDSVSSSTKLKSSTPVATTKSSGKGKDANKDYTAKELTYLSGDAKVEPNSVTADMNAGDTVELCGLGAYLTGLYFITNVKVTIDTSSGITLAYSLLKNGFGKTLKPYVPTIENTSQGTDVPISINTDFAVNDKVKFIDGVDATYSNSSDGVKVPDWVKQSTYSITKLSDDGSRALLSDIQSWTYVKFLQKI